MIRFKIRERYFRVVKHKYIFCMITLTTIFKQIITKSVKTVKEITNYLKLYLSMGYPGVQGTCLDEVACKQYMFSSPINFYFPLFAFTVILIWWWDENKVLDNNITFFKRYGLFSRVEIFTTVLLGQDSVAS